MIYRWKAYDFEITDFEYRHDRTRSSEIIPSQTLKHVEIIIFCDKPTYDTSLESS